MEPSIQKDKNTVHIVGAGLAGSECAFQLAQMGHSVVLYEMRTENHPETWTPAHKTSQFAELVCSNSLGSTTQYSAPGQLKWEAQSLNSLILSCANKHSVPAGMALGVDRQLFSDEVTECIHNHPQIQVVRKTISDLSEAPRPTVIATGPLTNIALAKSIQAHFDNQFLYFFDAIAPIVDADSIQMDQVFMANRFDDEPGDYLNCPMTKAEYSNFITEVKNARVIESKDFEVPTEETPFFDGCMPLEEMIRRGDETPRFGPLSPKGLRHHVKDKDVYAVVQLRKENKEGTAYNMVGFQTKMSYADQKRIFSMIPGLKEAEFLKLGSIHRNMYIHSPKCLSKNLASLKDPQLFFAGQITGVEGYFESTCIGLLVARFLNNMLLDQDIELPPRATALGSLLNAITEPKEHFQPTNINFSLLPSMNDKNLSGRKNRNAKRDLQIKAAQAAFRDSFLNDSTLFKSQ